MATARPRQRRLVVLNNQASGDQALLGREVVGHRAVADLRRGGDRAQADRVRQVIAEHAVGGIEDVRPRILGATAQGAAWNAALAYRELTPIGLDIP